MTSEIYLENSGKYIERLLSNMDRNKGSETFGCLSRPYWHDKVTDFPSAHQQIGVLPLALAYSLDSDSNPFYNSGRIEEYACAGVNFWRKIQKKNGSFDEHYPNEHSLGAVAWTLWSVTEACELVDNPPDIAEEVLGSVEFMKKYDEPGDIANHQAVAAVALYNAYELTGEGREEAEKRLEALEDMQSEEGWFQEYRGADIGYHTTTLSHLGRLWEHDKELVDPKVIRKALGFLSHFIDEENYYSGIIGSRNTRHIHSAGIEALSEDFQEARKICYYIRRNLEEGNLLEPYQMDDKHFSRQLAEYMDSYRLRGIVEEEENKIPSRDFETISVRDLGNELLFVNTSKGGVYKRYDGSNTVDINHGISVKRSGSVLTSNWPGTTEEKDIAEDRLVIRGSFRQTPRNTLDGYLFLASRLFNYSIGRSSKVSLAAKDRLISILIGDSKTSKSFEREIDLRNGFSVENSFEGEEIEDRTRTNFVPSSEFFSKDSLDTEL